MPRLSVFLFSTFVFATLISGCGDQDSNNNDTPEAEVATLKSTLSREVPDVNTTDLETLRNGLGDFTFSLYREITQSNENLFFSPYSVSSAFTMLYAGAEGETKNQMRSVLNFLDNDTRHHQAFNALDTSVFDGEGNLTSANSLWLQNDFSVRTEYLDTLALNYGADIKSVDFAAKPEAVRTALNKWISAKTFGLIPSAFEEGSITDSTRFVLVNTIYFLGTWSHTFTESSTDTAEFFLNNGTTQTVDMMHQTKNLLYTKGSDFSAVTLRYDDGKHKMVVILPDTTSFENVENNLSRDTLSTIVSQMDTKEVILSMPKYELNIGTNLAVPLRALGMSDAFDPNTADFSGIVDGSPLYVTNTFQKAVIKVDEEGTEAAAATAILGGTTSLPETYEQVTMTINRPFFFFIMNSDDIILFMGKVENPDG